MPTNHDANAQPTHSFLHSIDANQSMPSRRRFLSTMTAVASIEPFLPAAAASPGPPPPFADEIQRPPADVPSRRPGTAPPSLLMRADGLSIDSWDAWLVRRGELRSAWLDFLGPWKSGVVDDGFRVVAEDRVAGLRRRRIAYHAEPDEEVEAWLLEPGSDPPPGGRPGAVVFHATTDRTIDSVAAADDDAAGAIGTWLARAGFAVLCPRCHLWNGTSTDRIDTAAAVARLAARHPGARGMRKLLHDGFRAVDVLSRVEGVDPARIVAAGHSLGAKQTLYLAAFDDRVVGAVASEGGIAIPFSNWHDPWYLGNDVRAAGFPLDHAELVALSLPRGLLVLGGESGPGAADGDRSWPTVARAVEVGRLREERPWVGLFNHRAGHSMPPTARDRLVGWLEASAARGAG